MATNQENRNVERFQIALLTEREATMKSRGDAGIPETSPYYFYKGKLEDVMVSAAKLLNCGNKDAFHIAVIRSLDQQGYVIDVWVDEKDSFLGKVQKVWFMDSINHFSWFVGRNRKKQFFTMPNAK